MSAKLGDWNKLPVTLSARFVENYKSERDDFVIWLKLVSFGGACLEIVLNNFHLLYAMILQSDKSTINTQIIPHEQIDLNWIFMKHVMRLELYSFIRCFM